MRVVNVRLSKKTYEELEKRASRLGMDCAVLARAYIKESLNDRIDFSALALLAEDANLEGDTLDGERVDSIARTSSTEYR